jgi:hypothetical protein
MCDYFWGEVNVQRLCLILIILLMPLPALSMQALPPNPRASAGNDINTYDYSRSLDLFTESPILVDRPVNAYIQANAGDLSTRKLSGTVTFTNGSAVVAGTGTHFASELRPGDIIRLSTDAESAWARLATINTGTSVTLAVA